MPVMEAPDREPVKFGIAILGLFRQPADEELFQALGRHDEFTLFCAVALTNSSEDHDEEGKQNQQACQRQGTTAHVIMQMKQPGVSLRPGAPQSKCCGSKWCQPRWSHLPRSI
jgi:hypothetical protein